MPNNSGSLIMIVLIVMMLALMFVQMRKAKRQQQEVQDFRKNLQPGTMVQTIGGIIGTVVEVDAQYEEIVIDSEGSKIRLLMQAVHKEYIRPAFVDDSTVDEEGNPLPEPAQLSEETSDEVHEEQTR